MQILLLLLLLSSRALRLPAPPEHVFRRDRTQVQSDGDWHAYCLRSDRPNGENNFCCCSNQVIGTLAFTDHFRMEGKPTISHENNSLLILKDPLINYHLVVG